MSATAKAINWYSRQMYGAFLKLSLIHICIYVIRRRQLIELLERCAAEDIYDLVNDILVRYKNLKRIYAYKLESYWSNIATEMCIRDSLLTVVF